jgi:hypothetical protein
MVERTDIDRLEKKIDDQGHWAAKNFDDIRENLGGVKVEMGRQTTLLETMVKAFDKFAGVDKRVETLEEELTGRFGQPGMAQRVKELHEQRIEKVGEAKQASKTKSQITVIISGLTVFILGAGFMWGIFTWVVPHLH